MDLKLYSLEDAALLGRALARIFQDCAGLRVLLLRGDLGAGKTTLTRHMVAALEGGGAAEVCSPSFTLCNMYDTHPPVAHCDLYRSGGISDEIWDVLEDETCLAVIEWAEYLPAAALPPDYMDIHMQSCHSGKLAAVEVAGRHGPAVFAALESVFFPDKRKA